MRTNYVLFVVLSFGVLFGWNALVMKNRPTAPAPAVAPAALGTAPASTATPAPANQREQRIERTFGAHRVEFNAWGAGVLQWWEEAKGEVPLVLADPDGEHPLSTFPDLLFSTAPSTEGMAFAARRDDGLRVTQTYRIAPEGRIHSVAVALENGGKAPVDAAFALGWGPGIESGDGHARDSAGEPRALVLVEGKELRSTGNWLFSKLRPGTYQGPARWFAVDAHYFLAAFLTGGETVRVEVAKKANLYSARRVERATLAPGEKKVYEQRFYLGPKNLDDLAALDLGLERAVNLGIFPTLARWIHNALLFLKGATGNFGWAIIILTLCVQVLLSPLTVSSFKHGQKMKAIQPQMKRLQEMYKNDPRRLNMEMLALYQRHGLKLMGMEGCLPILLQMPVFFALYAALSKSFELRHSPWILWIKDLSVHDPYYVLTVLMGGAMFLQQKVMLNPSDQMQKQMMYLMPIVFTVMFLKMPAGLVLYWLTQSVLSFGLQFYLLKRHQKEVVL